MSNPNIMSYERNLKLHVTDYAELSGKDTLPCNTTFCSFICQSHESHKISDSATQSTSETTQLGTSRSNFLFLALHALMAEEVGRGNWSGGQRTFKGIWSSMSQATKSGRTGPHRMYSSRLDPKLHVIVSFCTNVLLNNCVLCSLSLLGCSSQPCCTVVIASQ